MDNEGKSLGVTRYDTFGRPNSYGDVRNDARGLLSFTGYEDDRDTGLMFVQARYYMPELGRFVEEDENKGNGFNQESLNYYAHCINNPLMYLDRDGQAYVMVDYVIKKISLGYQLYTAVGEELISKEDAAKLESYLYSKGRMINGHCVVDSDVIVDYLGLDILEAEIVKHQTGDVFRTYEDAAYAYELTIGLKAEDKNIKKMNDGYTFYCPEWHENKLKITWNYNKGSFAPEKTEIENEELSCVVVKFDYLYVMNPQDTWIYCNFPEQIPASYLKGRYYINKATNVSGKGRIFYSHANHTGESIKFIIRIKNKSRDIVTFSYSRYSHSKITSSASFQVAAIDNIENFYKSSMISIKISEQEDIFSTVIENGDNFTGLMDFETNGSVDITVFAVRKFDSAVITPVNGFRYPVDNKGVVEDNANYKVYSGKGKGYKIKAISTLKATWLLERDIGFETGHSWFTNVNHQNGLNELITLNLAYPADNGVKKAEWSDKNPCSMYKPNYPDEEISAPKPEEIANPTNYYNIGNWTAEYHMEITLHNDTGASHDFVGYLVPAGNASIVIMKDDSLVYNSQSDTVTLPNEIVSATITGNSFITTHVDNFKATENDGPIKSGDYFTEIDLDAVQQWQWVSLKTKPGEKIKLKYKYILPTDTAARVVHLWKLV